MEKINLKSEKFTKKNIQNVKLTLKTNFKPNPT